MITRSAIIVEMFGNHDLPDILEVLHQVGPHTPGTILTWSPEHLCYQSDRSRWVIMAGAVRAHAIFFRESRGYEACKAS